MKKTFITVIALCLCIVAFAQEEEQTDSQKRLDSFTSIKKHEVSLDVLSGLVIPAFNPRYEYILGRYSGVGADLFVAFDNDDIDFEVYEKFSLTPYYRQYFFSKEDYGAKGFYGEGFMKLYTYENYKESYNTVTNTYIRSDEKDYFETALGVGIGWKWVSNSGFLIDVGFGVGRDLGFANDDDDSYYNDSDIRVRGGVNFGWRF